VGADLVAGLVIDIDTTNYDRLSGTANTATCNKDNAWLQVVLTAVDLMAWTPLIAFDRHPGTGR
jgi:hypothetical protein